MTASPVLPRVLVLLAACNGAKWIESQIDSILAQKGVSTFIVVGDDGSTDGTLGRLEKYLGSQLRIEARSIPSGSAAKNFFSLIRANDAAGFDFVAFSDQDDIWNDDRLARASEHLRNSGCAGYSSATTAFWPNGRTRTLRQSPNPTESDFLFEGAGQGCSYVLSQNFYQTIRHFIVIQREVTEGLHYHDWTAYALARAWGRRWSFDSQSTLQYRQHRQNDTGARTSIEGIRRRLSKISNGWYRSQLEAICLIASKANPTDRIIAEWASLLSSRPGLLRRLRIAHFCYTGGRRRLNDRIILICAALLGWT